MQILMGKNKIKKIIFFFTLFLFFSSERIYGVDHHISLNSRQLCDLEMLLNGGFAPLEGFLNENEYLSVVENMQLENGTVWPIPIVFDVSEDIAEKLKTNDCLHLMDRESKVLAILSVKECWKPNKEFEAQYVYGTKNSEHPGVFYLFNEMNEYYVSGSLQKISLPNHYCFEDLRKTPKQLKSYFKEMGFEKVVAFQTRNPMHRAHVELTKRAMEMANAHLLIQPIVGLTKPGDIDSYTRVSCYRKTLQHYPAHGVTLSVLPLAMRMAGPREALWHAIIRKNYGLTHFIVGRDHASPGNDSNGNPFYSPFAAQDLLKKYADEIGIEMIPFQEIVYSESRDCYLSRDEVGVDDNILTISGTETRHRLYENLDIPSWFSYPEIIAELRKSYPIKKKKGICIFFTGLSGAGKSILAQTLCEKLLEVQDRSITIVDGDQFRKNFCAELGFSKKDRSANIHRAGYLANEIARNCGIAICAFIAPYRLDREFVRNLVNQNGGGYIEIYLSTSLETCEMRDVKGLYKKARAKEITDFTGIDDPYEIPQSPQIIIDTSQSSIEESLECILKYLKTQQYI